MAVKSAAHNRARDERAAIISNALGASKGKRNRRTPSLANIKMRDTDDQGPK